jgi:hypothetical protein
MIKKIELVNIYILIMFMQYNSTNYKIFINKQFKKEHIKYSKNKFNKKWDLPIIYENIVLYESFIIENYF